MEPARQFSSLRSLVPGAAVFLAACLVWFGSAGMLFFVAIPPLLLGTFLLLFSFAITKHSSTSARVVAGLSALAAVFVSASLLWSR